MGKNNTIFVRASIIKMLLRSGVQRQHYNKADGLERGSAKIGLSAGVGVEEREE